MHDTAESVSTPDTSWQQELARGYQRPAELLKALDLDPGLLPAATAGHGLFPVRVPAGFVARMRPGDLDDPLLRQVLPLAPEQDDAPGFVPDPVGDLQAMGAPGVLHKYHGRALLIATGACAINCRYCFRRHFPYAEATAARDGWRQALDYIAAAPELQEVILSGGDPLLLSDRRLTELVAALESIGHVRRLRIHSRLPVVLPERVDDQLLDWLTATPLQRVLVVHANHPAELDDTVARAFTRLRGAGVTLLNQAVLLAGINDSVATQEALSERLFELGVLPYYLHVLDRVAGARHFLVADHAARTLAAELARRLPGYLVPRLVRETAGEPGKTLLVTPAHG